MQRSSACAKTEHPCSIAAGVAADSSGGAYRRAIIDAECVETIPIKTQVFDVFAGERNLDWLEAVVVQTRSERERLEFRRETEVLKLVGRAEIVARIRDDAAQRHVGVSFLRE